MNIKAQKQIQMENIRRLYKTHLDVPPMLENVFSLLLFNPQKRLQNMKNLYEKNTFEDVYEYQESFLTLFQNEQYKQLQQEKHYYASLLVEEKIIPLFYKIRIDLDGSNGFFIFDAVELAKFPNKEYIDEIQWKQKHYKEYLSFKLSTCYFVSLHFQLKSNQWKNTIAFFMQDRKSGEGFGKIYLPWSNLMAECLRSNNIKTMIPGKNQYESDVYWEGDIYIYVQPLSNISSFKNELSALIQLSQYKYQDQILGKSMFSYLEKQPFDQNEVLKYCENEKFCKELNHHQLQAIQDSLNYRNKFTLIKGPPGTGKTQTTIGILSLIFRLGFKKNSIILLLGRTNTVVNDLVRRIRSNIIKDKSIINFDDQLKKTGIKLNVMRSGRADKCEEDIFDCSIEICAQRIFFFNNRQQLSQNCITYVKENLDEKHLIGFLEHIDKLQDKSLKELDQIGGYYKEMHYLLQAKQKEYESIVLSLLSDCNILVSTLNSVTHQSIQNFLQSKKIEICIVDEAPTALEPAMLIPMIAYQDIQKFVFLGDIHQLNPITKASESKDYSYNRSMYERFSKIIKPIPLLSQYRQLDNLAEITSLIFYKDQLTNGLSLEKKKMPDYLENVIDIKNNCLMFFTKDAKEQKENKSSYNPIEAQQILNLVKYLSKSLQLSYKKDKFKSKQKPISIIAAYKEQQKLLKNQLKYQQLDQFAEIDTIDSFQGKENDIVIISLVRSDELGFLSDKRRTNVALSRAKYAQYIFGNEDCLKWNMSNWSKLIRLFKQKQYTRYYKLIDIENINYFRDILLNRENDQ